MIDWQFLDIPFDSVQIPPLLENRVELESMLYTISENKVDDIINFIKQLNDPFITEQILHNLILLAASIRPFSYGFLGKIWISIPDSHSIIYNSPFTRYLSKLYDIRLDELYEPITIECNFPEDSDEYAIISDDLEKITYLSANSDFLDQSIDISIRDSLDILSFAGFCGSIKVFKFLLTNGMEVSPLTTEYLIKGGNYELIELVLNTVHFPNPELAINSISQNKQMN